jgi:hypothetical protein
LAYTTKLASLPSLNSNIFLTQAHTRAAGDPHRDTTLALTALATHASGTT